MNRVDVEKDGTKFSGTHVIRGSSVVEPFHKLANEMFDIDNLTTQLSSPITQEERAKYDTKILSGPPSYDTRRGFLDNEVADYRELTSHRVTICRLDYFQNANKNKLSLPDIFKEAERLDGYHLKFAVQDSGKDATAFDKDIRPLLTPGSYLDPASRSTDNAETYFKDLNQDDFKQVGLAHIIKGLTATYIAPKRLLEIKAQLNTPDNKILTFGIGPNINKPEENFKAYPDNIYLFGNNTKNKFFKDK
jgi:hypothetical protein